MVNIDVDTLLARGSFVELTEADGVGIDLRYATRNNFMGRSLYGSFSRFLLHVDAAAKLRVAIRHLRLEHPNLRMLLLDGLRPNRIQRELWAAVHGTPQQSYVGDPTIGSIHGFGLAVDLTLTDETGLELDMGTAFDAFTTLSEPQLETQHLAAGALQPDQIANRHRLRNTMMVAGFEPIPIEWWHFDAISAETVRGRYPLID